MNAPHTLISTVAALLTLCGCRNAACTSERYSYSGKQKGTAYAIHFFEDGQNGGGYIGAVDGLLKGPIVTCVEYPAPTMVSAKIMAWIDSSAEVCKTPESDCYPKDADAQGSTTYMVKTGETVDVSVKLYDDDD